MTALLGLLLCLGAAAAGEPDVWARDAVSFAEEQGLMDAGNPRAQEPATRAELAAMLTRLFGAQTEADLSAYRDVPGTAWYHSAMAKAVAMGLFEGSGDTLAPEAKLTREQAAAVLGRAYGVCGGSDEALAAFADRDEVGTWAKDALAAMTGEGYMKGNGKGINPAGAITRQELAQLLYNLTGTISDGTSFPADGNVLLRLNGESALSGVTVNGNLVLGGETSEALELRRVTVKGSLVLPGGRNVTLTQGSAAGKVVCSGGKTAFATETGGDVWVLGGSASVSGSLASLHALGDVSYESGTAAEATVSGATLTVASGAAVSVATLDRKGSAVTGEGRVDAATVEKKDCRVMTAGTELTEKIDAGVAAVKIAAAKPANDAKPSSPDISTTVKFTGVDTSNCDGADEDVRYVTLLWYADGKLAETHRRFALTEGATASFTTKMVYTGAMKAQKAVTVRLQYEDEAVSLTQTVNTHLELLPSKIQTIRVEATARRNTSVYSGMSLTHWIGTMRQGTTGVYIGYNDTISGLVVLPDGTTGWVRWSDLNISRKDYVQYTDYTREQKENFVNYTKGYSSTSDYLVWVNLKTQKVNIFTGAEGSWKLIRAFSCCTGKNSTPTIAGVFRYQYRNNFWDFGDYYVKQVMVFNGGHAFHTRTYVKATGGLLDPTIGRPASHGCVRMYDADVNWMAANIPFGSTVVVF